MEEKPDATPAQPLKVALTSEQLLAKVTELEMLDSSILTVQDITGEDDLIFDGEALKIELWSSGSEAGVKASHKVSQISQVRSMGLVRGKVDKKYGENADKEEVDRLVAHTKAFIHHSWPLTPRETYANPKLGYIMKQAQRWIAEDANFAKPSTPS